MYDRSATVYDLVYSHKDYGAEAAWVRDAIRTRAPDAASLLDVACGTGRHLEHLAADFACEGLDISEGLVAIATARTGLPVHLGDMDGFDLGHTFDAVVCLFSAIGYTADLDAAVGTMAAHVRPGGVLVVEPWFQPDQWIEGHIHVIDAEADSTRVIRVTHSGRAGDDAVMEMHHLVATAAGVEHFIETHRMTLFSIDRYAAAFRTAGLAFEFDEPGPFGRGALIGVSQ